MPQISYLPGCLIMREALPAGLSIVREQADCHSGLPGQHTCSTGIVRGLLVTPGPDYNASNPGSVISGRCCLWL